MVELATIHRQAQFNIGSMYDNGDSVAQDYKQAFKWYTKAAEQGFSSAQNNLAVMYVQGTGVLQSYVNAHMWFNLAAANGWKSPRVPRQDRRKMIDQISEAQRMAREMVEANPKLMGSRAGCY